MIIQKLALSLLLTLAYLTLTPLALAAYDQVSWPTPSRTLSSPYGPRLVASQNYRYDFHRGLDIPGVKGSDPVSAIADGVVYRTYHEGQKGNPYPNGGNVVILRHQADQPIPLHNGSYSTYYSLYLHLDSIALPTVSESGPYPSIKRGEKLGMVGSSGTASYSHLHLEIRVGTTCSLEYQLSHRTSACASIFAEPRDPSFNPLALLPYQNHQSTKLKLISANPPTVRLTSRPDELDLNRLVAVSKGQTKTIDFNHKLGIDPTNLDNPSYHGVTLTPARFSSRSSEYSLDITFSDWTSLDQFTAYDLTGHSLALALTLAVPGDLDGDGHVNLGDYNLLVANFGSLYTLADYNLLVANFGK